MPEAFGFAGDGAGGPCVFFFFIIGMRFVTWGSAGSGRQMRCGNCGAVGEFLDVKGMRFVTLFFVPVIPVGGTRHMLQCPACKTRYRAA